jgi:hypothetical protein
VHDIAAQSANDGRAGGWSALFEAILADATNAETTHDCNITVTINAAT